VIRKKLHSTCFVLVAAMGIISIAAAAPRADVSSQLDQFLPKRDYQGAVDFLEDFIDANPDDADAMLQLGIMYMKLGRHPDAVEMIEKAAVEMPGEAFPVAWLARANAEMGKTEEAEELLEKALDKGSGNTRLEIFAGGVAYELGLYDLAENIALGLMDEDYVYRSHDGAELMLLFFTRLQTGGLEAAEDVIDKVYSIKRQPPPCFRQYMADVFIGRGLPYLEDAIQLLETSGGECDECGTVSFRLGYSHALRGDMKEAAGYFSASGRKSCADLEPSMGSGFSRLMSINERRKAGADIDTLEKELDSASDIYAGNPYYNFIFSLVLDAAEKFDAAEKHYLAGTRMLPINFLEKPGDFSILTDSDYSRLAAIADDAEYDLEYFEIRCNPDHPIPFGSFFTVAGDPGLHNLFRFVMEGESPELCGITAYTSDEETIDAVYRMKSRLTPLHFSEDSYFLQAVYPWSELSERYWYVPFESIFPRVVEELDSSK